MNITKLELEVLELINNSCYGEDLGDWIWVSEISENRKGKINSGVISSLTQKNIVKTNGTGKDQCIAITDFGIEICKSNNLLGQYN
jgi:hypothetical protein